MILEDQQVDLVVTCEKGVLPLLACELHQLGLQPKPLTDRAVSVPGTFRDAMRLNLYLRTAQRVLYPVVAFAAPDADALYNAAWRAPWESLLFEDGYFSITADVVAPGIRDPRFAALTLKDAIADRIRSQRGRRPDSGPDRGRAVLHLHWAVGLASVYLDTSGEPLHRRTYRTEGGYAPLRETLAAAIVLATNWRGESPFVNPMCGSGTLAIEAALLAMRKAPGLLRRHYGFQHVRGYRESEWKELVRQAEADIRSPPVACRIIATDIDARAVEIARANADRAGVADRIEFGVCDIAETDLPPPPGVLVVNPPYGRRLRTERSLEDLYGRIGDFFKQRGAGYRGYVFTANLAAAKKIGLRSRRRLTLYNANLEGRLIEFDLYSGSRKIRKDHS